MGRSLHHIEPLPYPFRLIDERVITIPRGSKLVVDSPFFKVLAFLEGSLRMEVEGGGSYSIESGDIMVFPRPCKQHYLPVSPRRETRFQVARILFDNSLLQSKDRGGRKWPDPGSIAHPLSNAFTDLQHFRGEQNERVTDLINRALQEADDSKPGFEHGAYGLLLQATVLLLRMAQESAGAGSPLPGQTRAAQIVSQTRGYLLDNYARPLRLGDIALHLDLSEEHLARVFRECTGETVLDMVRRLRLEKARRLLLSSNDNLSSIARACGYRSLAVFSVNFKRATGMSPGAFRTTYSSQITYLPSTLQVLGEPAADIKIPKTLSKRGR